jgi:HD superfamily phosphohydrolase
MNKTKIVNDPIYGFITIPSDTIFEVIRHPWFQRLRRIKQLGLTDMVYPGALHTRFHHALGAMHLMGEALHNLRTKGISISDHEFEAAQLAILLHDVGHGPFSHALEHVLLQGVHHEELSRLTMDRLNTEMGGKLDLAIEMFEGSYPRAFFHQLVSSQLDIDRLDYLNRDCFFTGVHEGTIGAQRIIKMLGVHKDELIIEYKGIYSVENFLNARRLMYWQVYLHKTTISAEKMAIEILKRAQELVRSGVQLPMIPNMEIFLKKGLTLKDFHKHPELLEVFNKLDDHDIWGCFKLWQAQADKTLALLCTMLLDRNLFGIKLQAKAYTDKEVETLKKKARRLYHLGSQEANHFVLTGTVSNEAYVKGASPIGVLTKSNQVVDIAVASDLPSIKAMSKIVRKHYLACPKNVFL